MAAFLVKRMRLGAALALVVLIAACTAGPHYPLLSPVELTHQFGYDELPLGRDRFDVTYVTSPRQEFGPANTTAGAERALGIDMALWRAGEIALALGYPGFAVGDTRSDASVVQESGYYDGGRFGPVWGGWGATYWPPETTVQVSVHLSVTLLRTLHPGDYVAADVLNRLRTAYPGAEGLNRPPRALLSVTVPPLGVSGQVMAPAAPVLPQPPHPPTP